MGGKWKVESGEWKVKSGKLERGKLESEDLKKLIEKAEQE